MGEMADDLIDRMMDDGYFPSRIFLPRGHNKKEKVKEYPEKLFDMSFFPTSHPKPKPVQLPKLADPPNPWDTTGEEAPF